jgi:hypothetical protein
VLSYWTTNSSAFSSISGNKSGYPLKGKTVTINGTNWTYFEHKVTGITTAILNGIGYIDELRLYPDSAQMKTYTYQPLVGISGQCDLKNTLSFYEYDGADRLKTFRDQDMNVVKEHSYNYAQQYMYYNTRKSGLFTRNNCGTGYNGGTITYTVADSIYLSQISQQAADAQAQQDVDTYGQEYANLNGSCTSTGITITTTNNAGLSGFTATCINISTAVQTVLYIPTSRGAAGSLPAGTYNITLARTGNTSIKYIYQVCTVSRAAAVSTTFSNITINSSCNTITIDTVE